ncbi:MAG: hypothetical protein FJ091_13190 [Deltaproteobacteria bacterium]|nr:hypothetical protein [Deltaproteobacteria bacterium]
MRPKRDWKNAFRGPMYLPPRNTKQIRITIDDDVLEWFGKRVDENSGGNYDDLLRHALREYAENHPDGLTEEMRAVLNAPRTMNPAYLKWVEGVRSRRAAAKKNPPARKRTKKRAT